MFNDSLYTSQSTSTAAFDRTRTYDSLGDVCPISKREELQFKTSGTFLSNEGLISVSNEDILITLSHCVEMATSVGWGLNFVTDRN